MILCAEISGIKMGNQRILIAFFTSDIIINNDIYRADYALSLPIYKKYADFQSDILQFSLYINDMTMPVTGADIKLHFYDNTQNIISKTEYFILSDIKSDMNNRHFHISSVSHKDKIFLPVLRSYRPECSFVWGDNKCSINRDNFKKQIQILTILDTGYFTFDILSETGQGDFSSPYIVNDKQEMMVIMNLDIINHNGYVFDTDKISVGGIYIYYILGAIKHARTVVQNLIILKILVDFYIKPFIVNVKCKNMGVFNGTILCHIMCGVLYGDGRIWFCQWRTRFSNLFTVGACNSVIQGGITQCD